MAVGGASNFNEIARNPDVSSHRASPARTYVMKQLGLQTPGFWADWAARRINPYGQDQTQEAIQPQTPQLKPITPYQPQTWDQQPTTPTDLASKPYKSRLRPGGGGGGGSGATGRTKAALRQAEQNITWTQIKSHIAQTPTLSTTVLDTMDTERINMARQEMIFMQDNPSKMLTDAASDYFRRHPPYSAVEAAKTNFEKQVSLYSETKKMAEKTAGYAATEVTKQINNAIKNKRTYSAPRYMGGDELNIGVGSGYNSFPYLSSFG